MSDIYKPESIDDLRQQSSTVLQNAYNSGYIVGVEQGERLAEERIIKLLENVDDSNLWRQLSHSPDSYEGFDISNLIALIKGENK